MGSLKIRNFSKQLFISCSFLFLVFGIFGCGTNPNKPVQQDTQLEKSEAVAHDTQIGMNDKGEVVMSKKVRLADQLKDLQKEVYGLESEIYGHEEYGRKGLYGVLKKCLDEGDELKRLPARTILTKGEEDIRGKMVLDEKDQLVNVTEEYFLERIKRFESYKDAYSRQKDDFEEKVRVCEYDAKKKKSN